MCKYDYGHDPAVEVSLGFFFGGGSFDVNMYEAL